MNPLAAEIMAGNASGLFSSTDPERDAWSIFDMTHSTMLRHLLAREAPTRETTTYLVGLSLRILGSHQTSSELPQR